MQFWQRFFAYTRAVIFGDIAEYKMCIRDSSCTAWLLTVGPTAGVDPESFIHANYIVIWACNSVSTNLHHWHIIHEAQKKGAKVVVIDSYASKTCLLYTSRCV